jgi:hypothetical protein
MFMLSQSESNQTMNDLHFELLLCFASMRQADLSARKARPNLASQLAESAETALPALVDWSSPSHA